MATAILRTHDKGKGTHNLLQRLDSLERSACLHVHPVRLKLGTVLNGPLPNQALRHGRSNVTSDRPAVEVKGCLLPLVLRVEVWWPMLLVEHPDHDPEERGDDRHTSEVYAAARDPARVGLTLAISCEGRDLLWRCAPTTMSRIHLRPPLVSFIALFGGVKPAPKRVEVPCGRLAHREHPNDANGSTRAMGTPRNYTMIASAPKVA